MNNQNAISGNKKKSTQASPPLHPSNNVPYNSNGSAFPRLQLNYLASNGAYSESPTLGFDSMVAIHRPNDRRPKRPVVATASMDTLAKHATVSPVLLPRAKPIFKYSASSTTLLDATTRQSMRSILYQKMSNASAVDGNAGLTTTSSSNQVDVESPCGNNNDIVSNRLLHNMYTFCTFRMEQPRTIPAHTNAYFRLRLIRRLTRIIKATPLIRVAKRAVECVKNRVK